MNVRLKRNLIIGVVLAAFSVGAVIFLFLPFAMKSASFFIGLIAGLVFVSITFIVAKNRNRKHISFNESGEHPSTENSMAHEANYSDSWLAAVVIILLGGLASGFIIYKQNELATSHDRYQRTLIAQQSALIESVRTRSLVFLMENILNKVDDELKDNPERILSNEIIARIAILSHSLKPYTYFEGDSVSTKKLSPERGQLLLYLVKMNIAPRSIDSIMIYATFSGADLRKAHLVNAYLCGADLQGANLEDADLQGVNLSNADLRKTIMWGGNLSHATLSYANMKRIDLRWSNLNDANFKGADLSGANLSSALLNRAELDETVMKWATLEGAFLNEANLSKSNMLGAALQKAHLKEANLNAADLTGTDLTMANLTNANLRNVKFRKTNLIGTELNGVVVIDEAWFTMLMESLVLGAEEIKEEYIMNEHSIDNQRVFRLEKANN